MKLDWYALDELRESYLEGSAGGADYWKSDSLLSGYDSTFARRIAWKWHWVQAELEKVKWAPPPGRILDYGCGTGVAAREFLTYYGATDRVVELQDRSPRALRYAAQKVRQEFPGVTVETIPSGLDPDVVLVSHVISELDDAAIQELISVLRKAKAVIMVEPGTRADSAKVVKVREALREEFQVVAPCTHREPCGMLTESNARHWCHFFASPPPEVFKDGDWAHFSKTMSIDLRSLPLSFIVLDRTPPAALPPDTVRLTGNARLYKAHTLVTGCNACGVCERRLQKRVDPQFFRALVKSRTGTLQQWTLDGADIIAAKELK